MTGVAAASSPPKYNVANVAIAIRRIIDHIPTD
jgi:hypothetical protein